MGSELFAVRKVKRILKNKLPITKWPINAIIFGLHNQTGVYFLGMDELREDVDSDGNPLFVFKRSGEEIPVPEAGIEDKSGNIILVNTGRGQYHYATVEPTLDEDSKQLVLSLKEDEQMKYLFAKTIQEASYRYQPETPWWRTFVFAFLVFAIGTAFFLMLANTQVSGLQEQMAKLTSQLATHGDILSRGISGAQPP